ncbi:MAG: TlpA disulfide reductase family protein [Bacteroidota bacterium]
MMLQEIIVLLNVFISFFNIGTLYPMAINRPQAKDVVIIIENNTNLPVAISTDENYANLNDFRRITYKATDTLLLPIDGYGFLYFSHKNTLGDTVLASEGDTLHLKVNNENIKFDLFSKDKEALAFKSKIAAYYKSNLRINRQQAVDSLTKLFYEVNRKGIPIKGSNDFKMFVNYPLKANRTAFLEKTDKLRQLLVLLRNQYQLDVDYLDNNLPALSKNLYRVFFYKVQIEYYNKLWPLFMLSKSKMVLAHLNDKVFINQNLLQNPYSKELIQHFLENNVIKKKPDFSKSKMYIDYKYAYDSVYKYLPANLIKYTKYVSIENMVEYGEASVEVKKRFIEFKNSYHDQRLNQILADKFLFETSDFENVKKDLKLIDLNRKTFLLNDIIHNAKGKLIYIDFWASWCMPCRAAMPASHQLVNEFQKQQVLFIYLSIDKNTELWQQAINAEKLSNYKYSYQIINQDQALFIKEIGLKEIPRYLLFNKEGKLVHENAPGPDGVEIRALLTKYLKE